MVTCLNDFLGRKLLLPRGRRAADFKEASNLDHLQAGATVKKKVAEQAVLIIVVADVLAELISRLQNRLLLVGQAIRGNPRLLEPSRQQTSRGRHRHTSLQLQDCSCKQYSS